MRTIHFDTDLNTHKTLMFLHQSGGGEDIGGGKKKVFVKFSRLNPEEIVYVTEFINLLNIQASNFGVTLFNEDLKGYFYTQPVIGLYTDGQLGLMVGASNNTDEDSDFIPLVFKKTSDEDSEEIEGDYYFQVTTKEGKQKNVKCHLVHRASFYNPNEQRSYIVVKTSSFLYHIPFKPASDISAELVEEAWNTGRFELVCSSFFKANSNLSYLFRECFKDGTFPEKGVVLLLSNGQRNENQYNPNRPNSLWKLEASSHPDLLVLSKNRGEENLIQLREIGKLYVPDSCEASKHVISYPMDNKAFVLHITSPHNSGNLGWMPTHSGVSGTLINYANASIRSAAPDFFDNDVLRFIELANKSQDKLPQSSNRTVLNTPTQTVHGVEDELGSFDYPTPSSDDIPF